MSLSHLRLFTSLSLINVILNDTVMLITPLLLIAGFCLSWVIITGSCSFSTSFHHKVPLVMHTCEKLLCHLPSLVVETHGQELQNGRWLSWAEVDHTVLLEGRHSTMKYSSLVICNIFGYLQFVETKYLHAALCLTGYGASAAAVCGWYCSTSKELLHEAILKLAKRWQWCVT